MDNFLIAEDVFTILFVVTCFVAISETLLITFWNRFYFELGIPIFKYSAKYDSNTIKIKEERLNKIEDNKSLAKIYFKKYSENVFMFRESYSQKSKNARGGYTLLVRGMLYIDDEDSQITVYGILNTYPILFLIFSAFYAFSGSIYGISFFIFVLGFEVLVYFIQLKRYKSIAQRAALIQEEN